MTTGALVACSMLVMRAMGPVNQISALYMRWVQSKISLEILTNFMEAPVERSPGQVFVHHPRIGGEIVFDHVDFAYPGSRILSLHQAAFTIRPGEKVGIIGRAGSGKSTIARLVLGLYEPQQGRIRIDGLDLNQLDPAELRGQVCYFPQNLHLFRGTLRDNLMMANPDASDADITHAVEVSGAYRLVRRHPLGLDLPVGERGELLSGGQRQAIGLARALMRDGRIAIFDDPTSEMDATSENWVKERLMKWMKDRTFILITHRPSMLELVDRLIVVDDSHIVADGPKDKVLAALGVRAPVAVNSRAEHHKG
jgi:ATP-binding cassette subfamily C protein LapB